MIASKSSAFLDLIDENGTFSREFTAQRALFLGYRENRRFPNKDVKNRRFEQSSHLLPQNRRFWPERKENFLSLYISFFERNEERRSLSSY